MALLWYARIFGVGSHLHRSHFENDESYENVTLFVARMHCLWTGDVCFSVFVSRNIEARNLKPKWLEPRCRLCWFVGGVNRSRETNARSNELVDL